MNAIVFDMFKTKKIYAENFSKVPSETQQKNQIMNPLSTEFPLAIILKVFWFLRANFFNPTSETLRWNWISRKFSHLLVPAGQNCPICCHTYSTFSNFSAT